MAFLILLPPLLHAENPELPRAFQAQAEKLFVGERAALGAGAPVAWPKTLKAPVGARLYEWKGDFDAVLAGTWWFDRGEAAKPFLSATTLIRRADCVVLGQRVVRTETSAPVSFPEGTLIPPVALSEIAARKLKNSTTFRFQTRFRGDHEDRFAHLAEVVGSEVLAARGLPVNASFLREACAQSESGENKYPSRTHRLLRLEIEREESAKATQQQQAAARGKASKGGVKSLSTDWPTVRGRLVILSGVFGQATNAEDWSIPAPFAPRSLIEAALPRIDASSHDLSQLSFRVTKREGRWIYLDRGRAYGLEIGMHLLGPRNSKLHVIHFAPGESGADVAVALLRREGDGGKVAPGDTIGIDQTQYPPR